MSVELRFTRGPSSEDNFYNADNFFDGSPKDRWWYPTLGKVRLCGIRLGFKVIRPRYPLTRTLYSTQRRPRELYTGCKILLRGLSRGEGMRKLGHVVWDPASSCTRDSKSAPAYVPIGLYYTRITSNATIVSI